GSAVSDALRTLRVTRLTIRGSALEGGALARLLEAGGGLVELDAGDNPVCPDGSERIAAAAELGRLTTLRLSHAGLGPEGAGVLARSGHLGGLECLDLGSNALHDAGTNALVSQGPRLARLRSLVLEDNALGPDSAHVIAASSLAAH